jgi:hypothetical protein
VGGCSISCTSLVSRRLAIDTGTASWINRPIPRADRRK